MSNRNKTNIRRPRTKPVELPLLKSRSPVSLLPHLDGRSVWPRRWRELVRLHLSDLGGEECVSEAELALVKRAATLILELERRELGFAQAGQVSDQQLAVFQTTVNTLRRLLESIGLQRRAKEVPDLQTYLRQKSRQADADDAEVIQ